MLLIVALIAAYLIGSVSCAIIVCKSAGLPDPRTQGSGNPGASNILRVAGKTYAVMTLVGDALKGFVAIIVGLTLEVHGVALGLVGLAAVLGHMYPIFFKFKGGKGVATAIGVYFGVSLTLGVVCALVWLALVAILRYASVASLVAAVLAPVLCLFLTHQLYYAPGLALIALMIIWRHRENIDRLRKGTESKFVAKK
ncbi:MAG: acyl-phosphate glycerol 3-phosphate acyltransferase [Gammaproteobacteria bacterium CG11_big_fil_rev_8_21_14_0_20_46_22]|nr:MAG: acyl-phosphate glycerol 3-phosphate acyltransferase [Gammaproteobacteria bacterium CG12_big_fil_rev_8_21_14_0_65_46_12]PIR10164.1 MAG: acyl-phosphate glycerol 3-phosphate acyltransferase [Gammaproteobacteria bacterium CG11_big_fil_rev_8_21_14_0_20_46_22]